MILEEPFKDICDIPKVMATNYLTEYERVFEITPARQTVQHTKSDVNKVLMRARNEMDDYRGLGRENYDYVCGRLSAAASVTAGPGGFSYTGPDVPKFKINAEGLTEQEIEPLDTEAGQKQLAANLHWCKFAMYALSEDRPQDFKFSITAFTNALEEMALEHTKLFNPGFLVGDQTPDR